MADLMRLLFDAKGGDTSSLFVYGAGVEGMNVVREPLSRRRKVVAFLYWVMAVSSPIIATLSFIPTLSPSQSLFARIVAAVLGVGSLVCKGLGDRWARTREQSLADAAANEERRITMALGDLVATLGEVAELPDSRYRETRSVEAAEAVVVKLLEYRVREVRCCFYRMQRTDEELGPDENPDKNAFLQRVGTARGRGVHQPREKFTFADDDPDGVATLTKILADRPVYKPDANPQITGAKYGSFLSVPVHNRGKIVGMISADSTDVNGIALDCESLLRMVGALAALALDVDSLALESALGQGRGALSSEAMLLSLMYPQHRPKEGEQ